MKHYDYGTAFGHVKCLATSVSLNINHISDAVEQPHTSAGPSDASTHACTDASASVSPSAAHKSDVVINNDICYKCMEKLPPVKGKGKKLRKKSKIDWVGCDGCGKWFHCECICLKVKDIGDTFLCSECKEQIHK